MMSGRYSWRALSKASLASSASFWAFVAATTDALASVMLPFEKNITTGKFSSDPIVTYQVLVIKQGTLSLEQKGKDFVFFLLQLVFSLQCLAFVTVGCLYDRHFSPCPSRGCASPPAPLCRC